MKAHLCGRASGLDADRQHNMFIALERSTAALITI